MQAQKQRLADALEKAVFSEGQQLFPKGRSNDRCYLLHTGVVRLTAADGSVSNLSGGACIGERALVAGDSRHAIRMFVDDHPVMHPAPQHAFLDNYIQLVSKVIVVHASHISKLSSRSNVCTVAGRWRLWQRGGSRPSASRAVL